MKTETVNGGILETWTIDEVADAYDKNDIALIDVRTAQEYLLEHIEGALLLPMPFLSPGKLPSQEGKKLVFYCGSGIRSEKVARRCMESGMKNVAHMQGGFGAWKKAGKPYMGTDVSTGAPKRVEGKTA